MSVNEKMSAIANAIRRKLDDLGPLSLDAMAWEIGRLAEPEAYWASIFNNTVEGNLVNHKIAGSLPSNFQKGNTKLTGIDFPLITSAASVLCSGCSSLSSVKMRGVVTLNSETFQNCRPLEKIYFPSLTNIDGWGWTFSGCTNLEKAYFPKLTSIVGGNCFNGDSKLNTFILGASSVCSLSTATIFPDTPIAKGTGYIYVPLSLIDQYKTATNWSTFASQFRAIEDYPEVLEGWEDYYD